MSVPSNTEERGQTGRGPGDRLDSWKEIASYLGRTERTVRRWEASHSLPVHRLLHEKRSSVYAYRAELDSWLASRKQEIQEEQERPIPPVAAATETPKTRRRLVIAAAGVVIAAISIWVIRQSVARRTPSITSIAVLPFDNLSHDPAEEWFSDGMTETLITELAKVHSLNVISRTSVKQYKSVPKTTKDVGTALGVDAVVEGSALRVGDRVRITAQLISTSTDTHLWGNDFEGDMKDVLSLQRSVAQDIAREVGVRLTADEKKRLSTNAHHANPQAMAAYLTGLYQFNRSVLRESADLARQAIRMDPGLAPAHELLGMTLEVEADDHVTTYAAILPEAQASLQRALSLEPDRGMAMSWLGATYFFGQHDWVRAEANMRRGFELDPRSGINLAFLLAAQGKLTEAIAAADRSLLSDPANPAIIEDCAHIYEFARRYDDSVRLYRKAIALAPGSGYAPFYLHISLLLAGHQDEAFEAWVTASNARIASDGSAEFRDVYRSGGWPAVWKLYLERAPANLWPVYKRWALVLLHHDNEALDMLEALERIGDSWMVQLEDPVYDGLRHEPRFQALLKRIGYPKNMLD